MTSRYAMLAVFGMVGALIAVPAHLQGRPQTVAAQHEHQSSGTPDTKEQAAVPAPQGDMMAGMMAGMKVSDAKLDALVQKMNAAQGTAKIDAIAELLTAVVQEQRAMHASMMMKMMMGGMGSMGRPAEAAPKK